MAEADRSPLQPLSMYPVLIDLGFFQLHSYGLMLAIAFLVAVTWSLNHTDKRGWDPDLMTSCSIVTVVSALVVARLNYVWVEWDQFRDDLFSILLIHRGGLVFYGGLIGGFLGNLFFILYNRIPVGPMGDLVAPGLVMAMMLGRVGCFLQGCCYGRITDSPVGVVFPSLGAGALPRHPTQLYDIAYLGVILTILLWRFWRPHRPGSVMLTFLILYPIMRSTNELFRGDDRGGEFLFSGWSIAQATSIYILLAALVWYLLCVRGTEPENPFGAPAPEAAGRESEEIPEPNSPGPESA